MPLFEYECRSCGSRFEVLVSIRESLVRCTRCGGAKVTRLLSSFAVGGAEGERAAVDPGPCGACGSPVRGSCALP
jgi:putative FmdB family regulatory protein